MQPSCRQKIPLPSLLLKKSAAAALAAKATTTAITATTPPAAPLITAAAAAAAETINTPTTATVTATNGTSSRRCIFGCDDNAVVLCRFPVHDRQRCDNWLKFFRVSEEFVASHGLANLRVCLRHFHQQNQMAKTRMKTTPTRLQKDALTAEDLKRRLRQLPAAAPSKEALLVTSSVVVPAPKRTNSISSATSSISAASDAPSAHSDSEFVGAMSPRTTRTAAATPAPAKAASTTTRCDEGAVDAARTTAPPAGHSLKPLGAAKPAAATTKTLNGLLGKHSSSSSSSNSNNNSNIHASLKNRKVFMITERCDPEQPERAALNGHAHPPHGQKRKMYLIMEEPPQQQHQQQHAAHTTTTTATATNGVHRNGDRGEFGGNAAKKLTLVTDQCDAQLTQKFEQILPEILSRINSKAWDRTTATAGTTTSPAADDANTSSAAAVGDAAKSNGLATRLRSEVASAEPEGGQGAAARARAPITLPPKKNRMKIINTSAHGGSVAGATPVIVSAAKGGGDVGVGVTALPLPLQLGSSHKNINLSADFLFLMKMLPKLEAIPEPHKSHVKNCIEKIVTQNAALFDDQ